MLGFFVCSTKLRKEQDHVENEIKSSSRDMVVDIPVGDSHRVRVKNNVVVTVLEMDV